MGNLKPPHLHRITLRTHTHTTMADIIQKVQSAVGLGVVPVKVGDKINTGVMLKEHSVTDANVSLDNVPGKIIISVPGAMTPTCSAQAPGYIKHIKDFQAKGVKDIYICSTNDQFVMEAWKEKLGAASEPNVHFLADDTGKFSAALGLSFDATGLLGNHRSHRFAMLVEDGVVKAFEQESDPGAHTVTKAETFLAKL